MHALIEGLLGIGLACLLSMYLFGMTPLDMMLPFGGFAVVYSYIYFVVEDIKKTKQEGKVPTSSMRESTECWRTQFAEVGGTSG